MSEPDGLETRISALDTTSYEKELPLCWAFLWAVLGPDVPAKRTVSRADPAPVQHPVAELQALQLVGA
jgi:hypothetical protein